MTTGTKAVLSQSCICGTDGVQNILGAVVLLLLLLLLLLLTKRLTWHLVKKLPGHVTQTKNDDVFGRQRKKQES